jgi:hypothetical protein
MNATVVRAVLATAGAVAFSICGLDAAAADSEWQEDFGISNCRMQSSGRSDFFVLEPGYQILLEGPGARTLITVLDETKTVDGVVARVVEEREWRKGRLEEVARNYYAICGETKDVLYFGEDVDLYEHGKVVRHDGSWLAGKGNRPGLLVAGAPRPKMKYYREIAPSVAMDRVEIVSVSETCITPAGSFPNCMKIKLTSALEPALRDYQWYAPGIGMVVDDKVRLVRYGPAASR